MILKKVWIRDFRCVEDSTEFSLDEVTCLVGKNESGKTAVLKALHKLKPEDDEAEKFEPSRDYPRRKWKPGETVPTDPPAIWTKWELSKSDLTFLEKQFGKDTLSSTELTIYKGYENKRIYDFAFNENNLIKHLFVSFGISTDEKKLLSDAKTIESLRKGLEGIAPRSADQEKLFQALQSQFKDGAQKALLLAISGLLPTFLYFDQYLRLPGQVALDSFFQRKNSGQLVENDKIFLALLGLAGTTIENLHGATTFEEFNAAIRAVSNQISDQIFKYWSQNRHLDVEMRMDQARPNDKPPFNSGYVFRTRIANRRHRADTSFDDRSSGFVWFFSFLIWFYRLRDTYKRNLIILLDEPGLTLHARAQGDLLRYVNEQLRPDYQVVYTTHSPFMIDPDNLLSARTVEDVVERDKKTEGEILLGTKVGEDVLRL